MYTGDTRQPERHRRVQVTPTGMAQSPHQCHQHQSERQGDRQRVIRRARHLTTEDGRHRHRRPHQHQRADQLRRRLWLILNCVRHVDSIRGSR